ncbi:hypothetical protein V2J09_019586 [Rumex salicifolius]
MAVDICQSAGALKRLLCRSVWDGCTPIVCDSSDTVSACADREMRARGKRQGIILSNGCAFLRASRPAFCAAIQCLGACISPYERTNDRQTRGDEMHNKFLAL